jgi:amino acid transporter
MKAMSKAKYEGGQITSYIDPNQKKTHFSIAAATFFIYCASAGGAFGIESIISASGPGLTLLVLVLIPALWAFPMGLYVSELSNLVPADSGTYVWGKLAFGEFWGFTLQFWMAIAWYLTGAAYVVLAVDYLSMFFEISTLAGFIIKALIIIVFTIINLLGLEGVNTLDIIFGVTILAAFAVVAIVGLSHWEYSPVNPFVVPGGSFLSSCGLGIAIGVWMFCGYTAIANLGGEIDNPQVIPKGMRIAILIISLSYFLPTLAGIVSVGPWSEWGTTIDYASVLSTHVGKWAGMAFMGVAIIAQCALFNATTATAARSFMVLGKDHLCPKFLSTTSKKYGVPVWPIIILAIVNLVLVNLDFEILVIILSPLLFICYCGFAIAFVKIRKEYPVEKRGDLYYVKGKFSPAFIVGGMCLVGIVGLMMNGTEYFLMGYILIIAAIIFYVICKHIFGGCAVEDPENYPLNSKTKLCKGDLCRFGTYFLIFGVLALFGSVFLGWYEADWGPAYYLETYKSGFISNFSLMITTARWIGIIMLILAVVFKLVGKRIDPIPEDEE